MIGMICTTNLNHSCTFIADESARAYRRCPRSMLSRVYVTVGRPSASLSVRLPVRLIHRQQQRRPAGLLLSALRRRSLPTENPTAALTTHTLIKLLI